MVNFFKATTKKQQTSLKIIQCDVQRLDSNGCGVASSKKNSIFIEGCLPGESVTARVIEKKNKFTKAKLISIEQASEQRVLPKCQHFLVCGGCDLQHLSFDQHIMFKQKKVAEYFSRELHGGLGEQSLYTAVNIQKKFPWQAAIISDAWHYRRKARIGVQFNKQGQATIGFRQKGSNQLAAVKSCPVLVKPLADIFPLLKKLLSKLTIKQAIGHIEVIATDKTTVVVRQLKTINAADRALWLNFAEQFNWHIMIDNGDQVFTLTENSILPVIENSAALEPMLTTAKLHYCLADNLKVNFSVGDFIQINHQVNLQMVEQALNWLALKATDQVLDLFCGLGNFSLAIAQKSAQVVGVEGMQAMVDKAQANAELNNLDNCQFYQADLNSSWLAEHWSQQVYDKVLLDPARAGAENAIKQIITLNIPTILYVSCEPSTLARDASLLIAQGYQLIKIGLIDMFAQTKHVETMVLFQLPANNN